MLVTKKMLLALGLVGALVGAGIGALATRTAQGTSAATTTPSYDTVTTAKADERTPEQIAATNTAQFATAAEQNAYRQGFDEGYNACTNGTNNSRAVSYRSYAAPVYRSGRRASSSSRRVYYDYNNAPRGRTFWQKHRDKLTVAMGTGAGAILGGLIGGKKGAGIGALAGAGGSALYTYKIRKRHRNY
jgi:predicted lipid-binding transport protein (Tim44 family)